MAPATDLRSLAVEADAAFGGTPSATGKRDAGTPAAPVQRMATLDYMLGESQTLGIEQASPAFVSMIEAAREYYDEVDKEKPDVQALILKVDQQFIGNAALWKLNHQTAAPAQTAFFDHLIEIADLEIVNLRGQQETGGKIGQRLIAPDFLAAQAKKLGIAQRGAYSTLETHVKDYDVLMAAKEAPDPPQVTSKLVLVGAATALWLHQNPTAGAEQKQYIKAIGFLADMDKADIDARGSDAIEIRRGKAAAAWSKNAVCAGAAV